MWKTRKYVIVYRGKQCEGQVAQRIGKFAFSKPSRVKLLNKAGISIRMKVS
ncbi:hypothetical protein ROU88_08080 [Macrococcus capreoli]|uniref:hypothetical protein n=1 Tax=Macrococcus capreoli TaxID=2982690 RepID=UPI003EE4B320